MVAMIASLVVAPAVLMSGTWLPHNADTPMTGVAPVGITNVNSETNFAVIVTSHDADTYIWSEEPFNTKVFDGLLHSIQTITVNSGTTVTFYSSSYAAGTWTYTHVIHAMQVPPGESVIRVDHYRPLTPLPLVS